MIFVEFFILGAIVVIGSINLAAQAEVIEDNSKLNAAIIGIILALSTSLPELATSLTSTYLGQPQMAMGNVLGSNAFNFLILSFFNIFFFSKVVFNRIDKNAARLNIFSGIMYALFLIAYFSSTHNAIFGRLTLTSIGIFVTYILAIRASSSLDEEEDDEEHIVDDKAYKQAKIKFVGLAFVILLASIMLAQSADTIVEVTGMNASVVGAIFIGISTSLPELVTCYSLVRNDKFTMAATSIWGSNLFNFAILTIVDVFSGKPLLANIDDSLLGLAIMGLIFAATHFIQANIATKNKVINVIPSITMIGLYLYFFLF